MSGQALVLRVKMSPRYVAGLPMFAEVTLANQTADSEYYDLTPCDPWAPPFPVRFAFSAAGRTVTLPARSDVGREDLMDGFDLSPGEARTWVLDLSELDAPVPPGLWHCQARWLMRNEKPRWSGPRVSVAAAPPADVPLLRRLRLLGDAESPSWANFIETPSAIASPELRALSAESRRALVPYLIIHEAVHGADPLSRFPLGHLADHQNGPWASEAAVLGYELASARHAPDLAHQRARIVAAWPGVAYRLDEVDGGAGVLTALRDRVGGRSE